MPRLHVLAFALALAAPAAFAPPAAAQGRDGALPRPSPNAVLGQTVGVTEVTITYGRPAARDRAIFGTAASGALVPYGEVWRTGANEATTITFSTDVRVEGEALAAGTYGLFTVPGQDEWTVIFNRAPAQWGAYRYDQTQDVLRVEVAPTAAPRQEHFTILAEAVGEDEATFALHWAGIRVPFRVGVDADATVRARATAAIDTATAWRLPLQYADWAWQRERLIPEANGWADRAVALEANYATLGAQARLRAARGDHDEAVAIGTRAVAAARAMATPPGTLADFEADLAGWRQQ